MKFIKRKRSDILRVITLLFRNTLEKRLEKTEKEEAYQKQQASVYKVPNDLKETLFPLLHLCNRDNRA